MLINMIIVHVMEMAVVQIVDVTLMAYCRMPAIVTVPVRMVRMMILVASGLSATRSNNFGNDLAV